MTRSKLFFLLCAAPVLGMAQDETSVAGPIAGFVFDASARAIRPMLGVPGAGYMGAEMASDIDAAGIAPDGSAALAVRGGQLFLLAPLKTLAPSWTSIDGAIGDADHFAWSGDAAAIYSSASGRAQILRDLLKAPAAGAAIELSGLPDQVLTLALSGDDLLVGVAGGVYRFHAGDASQLVARAASPVALLVAGRDLYIADRDAGQIWQVPGFAQGATPVLFAGDIDSPVGIYLSSGRLFVASAGGRTLSVYGLSTHTASSAIDLAFTPASLDPMGSTSLLLMASGGEPNQPYYVLDAADDPAVYFVPVGGGQQ